jgi:hypothetical protein
VSKLFTARRINVKNIAARISWRKNVRIADGQGAAAFQPPAAVSWRMCESDRSGDART